MMPTCGTTHFRASSWNGNNTQWGEDLPGEYDLKEYEVLKITEALAVAINSWDDYPSDDQECWGPQVEVRGTQITFSALGQLAPIEAKSGWDVDFSKRKKLKAILETRLNHDHYNVRIGGTTSIDITRANIDKGFAIKRICDSRQDAATGILFLGDALFEGGNDWAAAEAGCAWKRVSGPEETEKFLEAVWMNL